MATTTYILDLKDLISSKIRNIKSAFADTAKSANGANSAIKILPNSIKGLETRLDALRKKQSEAFTIKGIQQYKKEIDQVERQLGQLNKKVGYNQSTGSGSGNMLGGLMAGAAGLISVGAIGALGQSIVLTSAKYEKFGAVLQNTFGSHTQAVDSMDMLSKWAANTPYQIDAATDSFIKLQNAGINPTYDKMTQLGDLSASRGKDISQLSEALIDAQMGEFERLKEFGIKGRTNKNGTYSFTFKGQTTEIKQNERAVQDYIIGLGKLAGIQGSMNAISQTTEGKLSNLADSWDQLKNVMGQTVSGPVKGTIEGLTGIVGGVKSWFEIPMDERLRSEQAEINGLVGAINNYNPASEQRNLLLGELVAKYPEYFGNLDVEKASNSELVDILAQVNGQYEKRIDLAKTQSQMSVVDEQYKEFSSGVAFIQNKLALLDAIDSAKSDEVKQTYIDAYNKGNALNYGGLTGTKDTQKLRSQLKEQMGTEQETANIFKAQVDALKSKEKEQQQSLDIQKRFYFKEKITKNGKLTDKSKANTRFMQLFNKPYMTDAEEKEMSSIMDGSWKGSSGLGGLGSGSSGGNRTSLGAGEIAGGRQVKNINIQIDKMGEITINNTSVKESKDEIKRVVYEALLEATNDINAAN